MRQKRKNGTPPISSTIPPPNHTSTIIHNNDDNDDDVADLEKPESSAGVQSVMQGKEKVALLYTVTYRYRGRGSVHSV
jgi:hypothetical protein